jgi:hypothetical protein
MSEAVTARTRSKAGTFPSERHRRIFLAVALGFVLASRLLLYVLAPDRATDFDLLYQGAVRLVGGENPYPVAMPYPLPAVFLALPFILMPLGLARVVFDVLVGWTFVYALWRHRGTYALPVVLSGAYLLAMWHGQTTPLMVAAALMPALGFLLAVKPNTSASLIIARPSLIAILGVCAFFLLSFIVMPSWPKAWWGSLNQDYTQWAPPVLRPFGLVLLLGALRWRLPEGRLLLATAFIPQNILPYELVALALVPANLIETGIYVVGTWVAVGAAAGLLATELPGTSWWATLCAVYLPMLYIVLRRPSGAPAPVVPRTGKERRRPHRLDDDELKVDITAKGQNAVTVRVTHIPTKVSASESGATPEAAARKAHDKLAGILAEMSRSKKEA